MSLLELQRDFRAWLTGTDSAATRFETRNRAGLGIYRNNYRAQLVACLAETYQRVKGWIGESAFLAAAARHIDATPPSSWTLDDYGGDFPQTLDAIYSLDPEVAELAWLDRALATAFVAADVAPLSPPLLEGIDWDAAVFEFTSTLKLGRVVTNCTALWSALSADGTPPAVEILPRPVTVLVWRKEFTSCFRTLGAKEAAAIAHFQAGGSFAALCKTLVAADGETVGVTSAGELLARWLQDGLIVRAGTSATSKGLRGH